MIKTGYIAFTTETAAAQDENGDWIAASKSSTYFINCNLQVITKEYRMLVDGQYQQANYSIYIEQRNMPAGTDLEDVTEVKIKDNNGNGLGSFQIQNVEYLNLTQRIKLVV